ncbi:MAG TPA: AraC family transcriptional regulator [Xanthobacteraceae bacterium]|nr:AraC family transcriptional regulator [Xanthobacteraceae bacterium]
MSLLITSTATSSPTVAFSPADIVERQATQWRGLQVESLRLTTTEQFEYDFQAPYHLLILAEQAERYDGETQVEGLPTSSQRECSRTLTFIPAGTRLHGWQKPRLLKKATYCYIDPSAPLLDPELGFSGVEFKPRLYFFDRDLWETALKLKGQIDKADSPLYAEALSIVLLHELLRLNSSIVQPSPAARGGLAGWQQKRVSQYIETHLSESIRLTTLAEQVRLSPYHFARAFKHSFGVPPHRYHLLRRMEQAKLLLGKSGASVTEIALQVGFRETSSFTAAFRKLTDHSPTEYRRSLD